MKNVLLAMLMLVVPTSAMASGKITFQPKYAFGQSGITPMFGLSVYERLSGPVFTNLWAGVGSDTFTERQETWYTVKNTFEVHPMSPITLGIGAEVGHTDRDALNPNGNNSSWRGAVFGKVAVQLW